MADKKPVSGAGSDNSGNKQPGRESDELNTMVCADWEVLLMDYLDGLLDQPLRVKDRAAFEAHRATCPACEQLLTDAKRGGEWLHFLATEPEVPSDLVARILEQTSGQEDALPSIPATEGMPLAMVHPGWLPGMERHAAQSRWIMTAAMAFFSIAFTLNLTGVSLSGIRLSDLTPTSLANSVQRQFHAANKGVVRYYDNLRFVYELESRVREMKQNMTPADSYGSGGNGSSAPAGSTTPKTQQNQPQQDAPQQKKNGGSASELHPGKLSPKDPAGSDQGNESPEPVMASFRRRGQARHRVLKQTDTGLVDFAADSPDSSTRTTDGTKKDRAERSLA